MNKRGLIDLSKVGILYFIQYYMKMKYQNLILKNTCFKQCFLRIKFRYFIGLGHIFRLQRNSPFKICAAVSSSQKESPACLLKANCFTQVSWTDYGSLWPLIMIKYSMKQKFIFSMPIVFKINDFAMETILTLRNRSTAFFPAVHKIFRYLLSFAFSALF